MKKDVPTPAQAKLLARLWSKDEMAHIGGYVDATHAACVKRGWLAPTDERGLYPSGQEWIGHYVSSAGLLAVERYLAQLRYEATPIAHQQQGQPSESSRG